MHKSCPGEEGENSEEGLCRYSAEKERRLLEREGGPSLLRKKEKITAAWGFFETAGRGVVASVDLSPSPVPQGHTDS